jgi:multidrug efflux pump subunit AcrA (membrane-fusion protein)
MSGASASIAVEQAQRRLRDVLSELRGAADQPLETRAFYRLWLTRLFEALGADAAECRLTAGEQWELVHRLHRADAGAPEADDARTDEMLAELRRTGKPAVAGGATQTRIVFPLSACGELRGAMCLDISVQTDAARLGCLKFIAEGAEAVERHHLLADRREALHRAADVEDESRFYAAVHGSIRSGETAYAVASEGRVLVGCDRLTVLLRHGKRYRIAAVSDQDVINRRSGAAKSLEALAARCGAAGEISVFPQASDASDASDEELGDILEHYVDESDVQRVVVAPTAVAEAEEKTSEPVVGRLSPALVIAEYFGATPPAADEMRRIRLVARCGGVALRNALEHESIFLLSLWRTLGRWRQACFARGSRRRTWLVIGSIAAALVALAIVPADFTVFCRGTLNPAVRRRVFAPLDGTVERIAVKHGERVKQGQVLVELRNTDLDVAETEVEGRRTAAVEQLNAVDRSLFDEGKRITAEERAKLSGERNQLREQIESFDRQMKLYAEKRELLVVRSPIDGEVTTWNPGDLLENRPVKQGQQLLSVADVAGAWELELRVPDDQSGRVIEAVQASAEPLRVTYSPAVDPDTVRGGFVREIHNSAELRGDEGNTVLVRTAIEADELPQRRPGAEAAAHVHCGRRSIGYVWSYDAYQFVKRRILFRWF